MSHRAYPLVTALLVLAALTGFTAAVRSDGVPYGVARADGAVGLNPSGRTGSTANGVEGIDAAGAGMESGDAAGNGVEGVAAAGEAPEDPAEDTGASPGVDGSDATVIEASGGCAAPAAGRAPIKVAYLVSDITGIGAALGEDPGRGGDDAGRADREFRALFDHLNALGGICGVQVEARGYRIPLADQADENRLIQRCIEVTEDFGAEFVIDTFNMYSPATQRCFADHGVVLVGFASTINEEALAQLVPYVATTYPTVDRQLRALTPALQEVAYLNAARVGVFLDDRPELRSTYRSILEPALRDAGVDPVVRTAAQSDSAAQANAVLAFRSAGVTHVVFLGPTLAFLGFSNTAEAQGYRPRYAFTDYQSMTAGAATFAAGEQLHDAVAVSACNADGCVVENTDRSSRDTTTPYDRTTVSPGMQRCRDLLSEARQTDYYQPAQSGSSSLMIPICDHFMLWRDAMEAGGGRLDAAHFARGLQSLGRSFESPLVFSTEFSDGRQSGASSMAAGVYDSTCYCFVRQTSWR